MSRARAVLRTAGRPALVSAVLALLPLATPAFGQEGNAMQGHQVARTWCESCHVVDAEQKSAIAGGAPGFLALAALPSTTAASLRGFLTSPHHPSMPDFQLSPQQIDDVSAYILSLKVH